jgi:hypothetical protein
MHVICVNVTDWQDANRWNSMISSLTIPQPYTPQIINTGRKNATIEWYSPYMPESADKTKFGFNVTVCDAKLAANEDFDGVTDCTILQYDSSKLHQRVEKRHIKSRYNNDDSVTMFGVVIYDLLPATSYIVR